MKSNLCNPLLSCRHWRRNVVSFTLIELLVVIAIIAILASLTMTSIQKAKSEGRLTACINNLKQINLAFQCYADDNDGLMVPHEDYSSSLVWAGFRDNSGEITTRGGLNPYMDGVKEVRRCPATPLVVSKASNFNYGCGGYGLNQHLVEFDDNYNVIPSAITSVSDPARTISFADSADFSSTKYTDMCMVTSPKTSWGSGRPDIHFRHGNKAGIGWIDGHVSTEALSFTPDKKLGQYNVGWFGGVDDNYIAEFFYRKKTQK